MKKQEETSSLPRPRSVRLHSGYDDADAFVQEVRALEAKYARSSPGSYETKGWNGISLIQAKGEAENTRSPVPSEAGPQKTPAFGECPRLGDLLNELSETAPILAARLLYLEPGGFAALHRDAIGFPLGGIRLHLPIITHPDVELWLGGDRMRWQPGDLWYGDFAYPHRLANPTTVTRVHLVIDVAITDKLLERFFPSDLVPALLEGGVCKQQPVIESPTSLQGFEGSFHIPRSLLLGVPAPEDLTLSMTANGGGVVARGHHDSGEVALHLDPIAPGVLAMRGYYQGVTFELSDNGEDVVELVHRGRVTFNGNATDTERTPWDLFTSRSPLERLD